MLLGNLKISIVSDGTFRLDGGTLFGIVPKTLWEKKIQADAQNRIELAMNCLLIQDSRHNILVDTGMGSKMGPKETAIYAPDRTQDLEKSLYRAGLKPEDIDAVLITHLHMDHVGGATKRDGRGKIIPTFANAKYYVQRTEWEEARSARFNKRSYMLENYQPLQEHDCVELLDGSADIFPGVRMEVSGGHTKSHCCVLLASGGQRAIFFSDLVPTTAHLRTSCITSYDVFPAETIPRKEYWINKAVDEKWLCLFYHDPTVSMAYVKRDSEGQVVAIPLE